LTALAALAAVHLTACGGGATATRAQLPELRQAIDEPVESKEANEEHSRLVEAVAEDGVLDGMSRSEVQSALGRGDPCSRHPKCAENGFDGNDWYYSVGRMGEGGPSVRPVLIVGFDRTGQVDRTWNLRVH
jgi:outer membrane protein assembly factor BamE (lipoprotein component of BamABCDE complex)